MYPRFFPQQYLKQMRLELDLLLRLSRPKLQIINKVATIAVALVIKLPADLENIKFSCETPIPKAPPSDFCISTSNTKINANTIFSTNNIFSMGVNYMFFNYINKFFWVLRCCAY